MPSLILSLPPDTATVPEYDYLLTPDGQRVTAQGRAPASLLPGRGERGTEVVAVLPPQVLSWHPVSLPERVLRSLTGSSLEPAKARNLLAGVLEENLLDEPETLHFAVCTAPGPQGPQAWVAVCARDWLQARLTDLEAAGRAVSRIVAEHTPVAAGAAQLVLVADQALTQMLWCSARGVCQLPVQPGTLALARADASLQIFAEPAVLAHAQGSLGNAVQLQTRAQRLLQAAQSPWNLAQLELRSSAASRLQRRVASGWQRFMHDAAWRPTRWGLLAALGVQVFGLHALAWQQRSLQARQQAAVQQVLRQTFPEIQLVIDAPVQMQRALDELARARGQGPQLDLGRTLSALAPLLPQGMTVSSLELQGEQLQLGTQGLDAANAQPVLDGLQALGLQAQLQAGQLTLSPQQAR